jgi:hypothetical protein
VPPANAWPPKKFNSKTIWLRNKVISDKRSARKEEVKSMERNKNINKPE